MKQTFLLIVISIVLIALIGLGYLYYSKFLGKPQPTPISSSSPTTVATTKPSPTPSLKEGWTTYKNSDLGFEISYPVAYKIQEDKYGWPKAVLLLYKGGQSYDLVIEVWNSASEYENKYKTQMNSLTVKKIGAKYITLLNMNFDNEVNEIISTFKSL